MNALESLVVMNKWKIKKTAHYLPNKVMTNNDYAEYLDTSDEWIYKRTGIKQRHINEGNINELIDGLLANANLEAADLLGLDGIIVATSTNLDIMPNVASYVHGKLSLKEDVFCIDVNSACSGFIAAMMVADGMLYKPGQKKLVIGIDQMSRVVDQQDRNTCILFGDGAGLMLMESSESQHVLQMHSTCDYNKEALYTREQYIQMRGQEVFKYAVNDVVKHINYLLEKSDLEVEDLDYVVCHQANERILKAIRRQFKLTEEQVLSTIRETANTSSASIPICFDQYYDQFQESDKVIMIGFGAGLITNSVLYEI